MIGIMLFAYCDRKSPVGPDSKEPGTVTDVDGNVYQTVRIGNQIWMTENLRVTRYYNGDPIPLVTDGSVWADLQTGARCSYNNNETNADTYGYLYNWQAVNDSRNIAPSGWRVPTVDDWHDLAVYLGGSLVAGGKMKETGTSHWRAPNRDATNESGFTALPGGSRTYNGNFCDVGYFAVFWSATECGGGGIWTESLYYNSSCISRTNPSKEHGFSVRLIREY